ncbi:hypothetical protein [Caulobacter sp.]|uniref:hypothetical protein n=1 Tax=Caulobacter sp. TaxID=78 RepID=UPI003BAFED3C
MGLPFDVRMIWAERPAAEHREATPVVAFATFSRIAERVRPIPARQAVLLAPQPMNAPMNPLKCREKTSLLLSRTTGELPTADGSLLSKGAFARAWALETCRRCRACPLAAAITPPPALSNA